MNNGVAVVVFTDGRYECITRAIASIEEHLQLPRGPHRFYIIDDSGDALYRTFLQHSFTEDETSRRWNVLSATTRRGFGGTIRYAWDILAHQSSQTYSAPQPDWVWHHEDDFVLKRDVNVERIQGILVQRPAILQMALRRQAWSVEERQAGGIVEQAPDDYKDCAADGEHWLEHRKFFTTNPSLYQRALCGYGWPDGDNSEGRFGISVFGRNPAFVSGYWGKRSDDPWCEHIGHKRMGTNY